MFLQEDFNLELIIENYQLRIARLSTPYTAQEGSHKQTILGFVETFQTDIYEDTSVFQTTKIFQTT